MTKIFFVRLEDEVFEKLEPVGGKNPRIDYLSKLIETHFNEPIRTREDIQRLQDLKKEVIQPNERLSSKDNGIKTINESLGRAYNEVLENYFEPHIYHL